MLSACSSARFLNTALCRACDVWLSVLGEGWHRGVLFIHYWGGYYAPPIHITVIKTILRHTAETSSGRSIVYMCCSDWWRREDAMGLYKHMCVMTGNISFPVCRSLLSSHIYVPMYHTIYIWWRCDHSDTVQNLHSALTHPGLLASARIRFTLILLRLSLC